MEGALHGVPSVALSQYFGPATAASIDPFAAARAHGAPVIARLIRHGVWQREHHGVFYNVNFPAVAPDAVKGLRATVQGHRDAATFGVQPQTAPNGRSFLWLTHGRGNSETLPGTDSRECHDGHVTVTPLTADLTAHALVAPLAEALA
jgi:5'-nucleotidase